MSRLLGAVIAEYDEMRDFALEHMDLIKYDVRFLKDAPVRMTTFLQIVMLLTDYKQRAEAEKARTQTMVDLRYHAAAAKSDATNIPDKKADAVIDPQYAHARESLETIESIIQWSKKLIDVYNNAHLAYRQMARE